MLLFYCSNGSKIFFFIDRIRIEQRTGSIHLDVYSLFVILLRVSQFILEENKNLKV